MTAAAIGVLLVLLLLFLLILPPPTGAPEEPTAPPHRQSAGENSNATARANRVEELEPADEPPPIADDESVAADGGSEDVATEEAQANARDTIEGVRLDLRMPASVGGYANWRTAHLPITPWTTGIRTDWTYENTTWTDDAWFEVRGVCELDIDARSDEALIGLGVVLLPLTADGQPGVGVVRLFGAYRVLTADDIAEARRTRRLVLTADAPTSMVTLALGDETAGRLLRFRVRNPPILGENAFTGALWPTAVRQLHSIIGSFIVTRGVPLNQAGELTIHGIPQGWGLTPALWLTAPRGAQDDVEEEVRLIEGTGIESGDGHARVWMAVDGAVLDVRARASDYFSAIEASAELLASRNARVIARLTAPLDSWDGVGVASRSNVGGGWRWLPYDQRDFRAVLGTQVRYEFWALGYEAAVIVQPFGPEPPLEFEVEPLREPWTVRIVAAVPGERALPLPVRVYYDHPGLRRANASGWTDASGAHSFDSIPITEAVVTSIRCAVTYIDKGALRDMIERLLPEGQRAPIRADRPRTNSGAAPTIERLTRTFELRDELNINIYKRDANGELLLTPLYDFLEARSLIDQYIAEAARLRDAERQD